MLHRVFGKRLIRTAPLIKALITAEMSGRGRAQRFKDIIAPFLSAEGPQTVESNCHVSHCFIVEALQVQDNACFEKGIPAALPAAARGSSAVMNSTMRGVH